MKSNILTRIYAVAMSAVFATLATAGVAVLMTSSGELSRAEFAAGIPGKVAPNDAQAGKAELTQWKASAFSAKQAL